MTEPTCGYILGPGWGGFCGRHGVVGVGDGSSGFWVCPAHVTLADGWQLVRTQDVATLVKLARDLAEKEPEGSYYRQQVAAVTKRLEGAGDE